MGARTAPFKLFNDDCININKYCRGSNFDLIYLDPPFGTGNRQNLGKHSYDDCAVGAEYLDFITTRLSKVLNYLSPRGTLLIHLDRHYVYEIKNAVEELGMPFRGDIIWAYRRWASNVDALQSNHDTILVFSKNDALKKSRAIFSQSIVAPSSKERIGYPTQKPLALLKRVISHIDRYSRSSTVLDPFMGSGTTLAAALSLGKHAAGFDISRNAVRIVETRLKEIVKSETGKSKARQIQRGYEIET